MPETQKKEKLKGTSIALTVIVLILAFSNILVFINLQNQVTNLTTEKNNLTTEKDNLQNQVNSLQNQITNLTDEKSSLQNRVNSLQNQITNLTDEKANLQLQLDSLNTTYQDYMASHSHSNTEYDNYVATHHYDDSDFNALELAYSNLSDVNNKYISAFENLRYAVNRRTCGGNGSSFITPRDPRVMQVVREITGGWSEMSDWSEFWGDVEAMYFWVRNNIQYRYDGLSPILPIEPWDSVEYTQNMWQFSNETLDLKQGDCEDQAILLCSMIICYSGMPLAEAIGISNTVSHLAVQIPVEGDRLVILDPAGNYYSHDTWGNIVADDLEIAVNKWLDYWKPSMGEAVHVSEVFSDQMTVKYFLSTSEYLNWMYSR